MFTSSANSKTVELQLQHMTSLSFAILSTVFDVYGCSEQGSSSVEVQPLLKVFTIHTFESSLKPHSQMQFSNVFIKGFPNLTQNFTQVCYL